MKKPIIGLTPSVDEEKHTQLVQPGYLESVQLAGGIGILLPLTESDEDIARYMELCDGFLFVGGPDIEPWRYGQETLEVCGAQSPKRDALEIRLMQAALAADKPILGVCRGLQMLNVVLGGTLYQDLPSQLSDEVPHRMEEPYNREVHPIEVLEGTPLAALSPLNGVNTRHHQAVRELAPGLQAMAKAPDGVIEAAWMPEKKFVWAVQWHPEAFWEQEGANRELFGKLIAAAAGEPRS